MAAMLFGVIDQFDGQVRWQQGASGLRDVMARTAKNCKVGTNQVYNECKQRKQDLQDIVGGAAYQGPPGDPDATWQIVCDRSPLMQRLKIPNGLSAVGYMAHHERPPSVESLRYMRPALLRRSI